MTSTFIGIAALFLIVGIVVLMIPTSSGNHDITIRKEGSVVTVRSAGNSNITVSFDPSDLKPEGQPVELAPGMERFAEEETTLLEEFTDPNTSLERKLEIARTFNGLQCLFKVKGAPAESSQEPIDLNIDEDPDIAADEGLTNPQESSEQS